MSARLPGGWKRCGNRVALPKRPDTKLTRPIVHLVADKHDALAVLYVRYSSGGRQFVQALPWPSNVLCRLIDGEVLRVVSVLQLLSKEVGGAFRHRRNALRTDG